MDSQSSSTLPVFIQPTDLKFIVSNPETHKRVITVYNPYDFSLRFTVLSNAPTKYRVVEARGFIRPKCYTDIIIRHLSPTLAAVGANDCLRIEIYKEGDVTPCGRKDVLLNVLAADTVRSINQDQFRAFPGSAPSALRNRGPMASYGNTNQPRNVSFVPGTGGNPSNMMQSSVFNGFIIFCFVTCVFLLVLPTAPPPLPTFVENGDSMSSDIETATSAPPLAAPSFALSRFIPSYLRPTATIQLVASYALGLLTALFFFQPYR